MDVRQYGSAQPFTDKLMESFPNVVDRFDKQRLATYALYEDFYKSNPETLRIIVRGDEDEGNEVHVPTAKTVINTTCRYLGKGFRAVPTAKNASFDKWFKSFWKRQGLDAKHASNKRWGLVRGDELWYIRADEDADEGQRIDILELNPANYFPIIHPEDDQRITGCYIVDTIPHPDPEKAKQKQECARVQKYVYDDPDDENNTQILYSADLYEVGEWDDRDPNSDYTITHLKTVDEKELDPRITHLPVYHIRPYSDQNAIFGTSELSGMETLMTAINQSYSDEDLAMAVRGLGVWSTDSGPPVDELGNPVEWEISPGRVIERDTGTSFDLVTGVPTVEPSHAHMKFAQEAIKQGTGTPEVAVGMQDVAAQISGVALKLHFDPMVARIQEMHYERISKLDQMWHDLLHAWLPVYEPSLQIPDGLELETQYDDPMPVDVDAEFEKIIRLFEAKIISAKTAIRLLNERCGYEIDENDFERAMEDAKKAAEAADPFGAQMAAEKDSGDEPGGAGVGAAAGRNGSVPAQ